MKYCFYLLLLLTLLPAAHAQIGFNSPAGVTPRQDFEIYTRNGLLVQQKYTFTTADPNASVNTLSCAAFPPQLNAQAGIFKDPGGDGNYSASLTCTQRVFSSGATGFEVVFEDLDTEAGNDLVIINPESPNFLTFSGSSLPLPFFTQGSSFTVRFQSNSNVTVGRGFRLRWRAVFTDTSSPTVSTAFGRALQFDAKTGALLGGLLRTGALLRAGDYSIALGVSNTASGNASTALGESNNASANASTALGQFNTASGYASTALGAFNTTSGTYSTALGDNNTASGYASTALGLGNTASGEYSTALGYKVSTNGQDGAFIIGDSDPLNQGTTLAGVADRFVARFLNGYFLMTCGDDNPGSLYGTVRTGVQIGRGQSSWATISDSTKKERFRPINPTELLRKINAMKLTSWNYKGQREIRHYGPMAQDFYAAFGHDGLGQIGCDTLIYSHDFAGVTFAGVQALVRENEQLRVETQDLRVETQNIASLLAQTKTDFANRLNLLERALLNRRERVAIRKRL